MAGAHGSDPFAETDDQQQLRQLAREVAERELAPRAHEHDESGEPSLDAAAALAKADLLAQRNAVTATPSFLIGKTGGTLVRFSPSALEPKVFTDRIDQVLAGQ